MADERRDALYEAFLTLKTVDEVHRFLRDLATPGELDAFAERWAIAQLLDKGGMSYRAIAEATGASTTTVTRVARFLNQEDYAGYRTVLSRIGEK